MPEHKVVFVQNLNTTVNIITLLIFHLIIKYLVTFRTLEHIPEPLGGWPSQGEWNSSCGEENPAAASNSVQTSPGIQLLSNFLVEFCF